MAQALDTIIRENISIKEANMQFGVAKSTLGDRVSGKVLTVLLVAHGPTLTIAKKRN